MHACRVVIIESLKESAENLALHMLNQRLGSRSFWRDLGVFGPHVKWGYLAHFCHNSIYCIVRTQGIPSHISPNQRKITDAHSKGRWISGDTMVDYTPSKLMLHCKLTVNYPRANATAWYNCFVHLCQMNISLHIVHSEYTLVQIDLE